MSLVSFFILVVLVGLAVWIANMTPIPPIFKQIILWFGVTVVVLVLLSALGLLPFDVQIPRVRG